MSGRFTWRGPVELKAGSYAVYSREFQTMAEDLVARSDEKNLKGATLAYINLTMNCVNCHKGRTKGTSLNIDGIWEIRDQCCRCFLSSARQYELFMRIDQAQDIASFPGP